MTGAALAILLVVISILIFCSALFSGLETALFSLKPYQLRRLDESFEKLVVIRIAVQPKLLENIVRFVISLLVPALKKGAIKWMLRDVRLVWVDLFSRQVRYESRNPLAFSHEGF